MVVKKIPDAHNSVSAYLIVDGGERALEFYKKAFGATELFRHRAPDGKIGHAEIRIGDTVVMLADEFPDHERRRGGPVGSTGAKVAFGRGLTGR